MPEIDSVIITGLTMWLTELCKRKGMNTFYAPITAFAFAGVITVGWNTLFLPSISWQVSMKEGLTLGAMTGGLYSFGKSVLNNNVKASKKNKEIN